jgi:hypothetical protein
MQNWQYDYNQLIEKMDHFVLQISNPAFSQIWTYTKAMVFAHAQAIRPDGMSLDEAHSLAWSQFESTFDEHEDDAILSLVGIVIHLVNAVPLGKTLAFHDTIEVGFAMARGFSEVEAIAVQKRLAQEVGAFISTTQTRSCALSVVNGGKQ